MSRMEKARRAFSTRAFSAAAAAPAKQISQTAAIRSHGPRLQEGSPPSIPIISAFLSEVISLGSTHHRNRRSGRTSDMRSGADLGRMQEQDPPHLGYRPRVRLTRVPAPHHEFRLRLFDMGTGVFDHAVTAALDGPLSFH